MKAPNWVVKEALSQCKWYEVIDRKGNRDTYLMLPKDAKLCAERGMTVRELLETR